MQHHKKTLVAFATGWGPQFGGINSFNIDFLVALAVAFHQHAEIFCIVPSATAAQIEHASKHQIQCISLDLPNPSSLTPEHCIYLEQKLKSIGFNALHRQPDWLGHDRITGAIALHAAQQFGGRSVLIHHMSFDHYESFCETSQMADAKNKEQKRLFRQADISLAVGPLLADSLAAMLQRDSAPMLVPGLADIPVSPNAPKRFIGFISGRLGHDAKKLKQGYLGITAFANAIYKADQDQALPTSLNGSREPMLLLRGVQFDTDDTALSTNSEQELKLYAEQHAGRAFTIKALPFTTEREDLFDDLQNAAIAMMPSWHEGFGLVGWEAIAAGIPLIVSQKSGLYRLLDELEHGIYKNLVYPLDVLGSNKDPYFRPEDRDKLTALIFQVAKDIPGARTKAYKLRERLLAQYTWQACAESFVTTLGWLSQGTAPPADNQQPIVCVPTPVAASETTSVLEMPIPKWQRGFSDSRLLQAEEAVLPFVAEREPFLHEQMTWAQQTDYIIAVRLLTGSGGAGKTRLAIELCQRLQKQGWQTGFLPSEQGTIKHMLSQLHKVLQPCLLVIDYAETRQTELLQFIKLLIDNADSMPRVRILLLARDGGEWWDALSSKDATCEALLAGSATTGPYPLPKLHDSHTSRMAVYQNAMQVLADKLQLAAQPCLPNLTDEQYSHPLFVQMAALLALRGAQPGSAEAVARAFIGHERRYWKKALAELVIDDADSYEDHAELLLILATLLNEIPLRQDGETLWLQAGGDKLIYRKIYGPMAMVYPGKQGMVGLRPDLLGEALVAKGLLDERGQKLLDTILGQKQARLRRSALTVLARILLHRPAVAEVVETVLVRNFVNCATDFVAVLTETKGPLARSVEHAYRQLTPQLQSQAFGLLEPHLEALSLPLVDLAVLVWQTRLTAIKRKCSAAPNQEKAMAEMSYVLNRLSIAFSRRGNAEDAAETARQALDINAKLVQTKPERYQAKWALSLSNYATQLAGLGQLGQAAEKALQALNIREKLWRAQPQHFAEDWAGSLNNYANYLSELGQTELAAEKALQALQIHATLAQTDPERHQADWAMSLDNYASLLSELGEAELAAEKTLLALNIREKLAQAKPERYQADWAASLNNYAIRLSELGEVALAADKARQALEINKKLASEKPERYQADWAMSLSNYAGHLSDLGQAAPAAEHAQQALELYQQLNQKRPRLYQFSYLEVQLQSVWLQWLASQTPLAVNIPVSADCSQRQQNQLDFMAASIKLFISEQTVTAQSLAIVAAVWQRMDIAQQNSFKDSRLLLGCFCHQAGISNSLTLNWQQDWQRYCKLRKNRLPDWFSVVLERHGLHLPEMVSSEPECNLHQQ